MNLTGRLIPDDCQIVFVSDLFVEDYVGGAELTSQAIIESSPFNVFKLHSRDVTLTHLEQGHKKFWIFGNFAQMNPTLIPTIVANMSYSVLEYDYKYCRYRSPEKHKASSGVDCDCHEQMNGKLISSFYYGAKSLWWMSEAQMRRYHTLFPFLAERDNIVLSSVFDQTTLRFMRSLSKKYTNSRDDKWIVLGSDSWVKGFKEAERWCIDSGKQFEVVWNLPYNELLVKLAQSKGFVYLPAGADTCPRMVIEAKLLGCELHLNNNVQHKDEEWFNSTLEQIEEYLLGAPDLFWNSIRKIMNFSPTISGYTTTYDCIRQQYPFEACISSMLMFCNEVCVVDGGSSDGTWEKLSSMSEIDPRIKLQQISQDTSNPRFAIKIDGQLKAAARSMCTSDFCWQMDSDEIVAHEDAQKIKSLCASFPQGVDIISLPVIEYWGSTDKVRIDITPWKWRLSRNKQYITHGIPVELRRYDESGELYAAPGTDSCDLIDVDSGQRINHITFVTRESESARSAALEGNVEALKAYQNWYESVTQNLPSVHHYSWYDMARKIRHYRDYWCKFWPSMYGQKFEDTAENNVMFDVPWSQVTDDMITKRAQEFSEKLGGWIWHRKWDGITKTPWITLKNSKKLL